MTLSCRVWVRRPDFELRVDVCFEDPAFIALFGASGSGKTTLLRCIAGLERADEALIRMGNLIWQDARTFVPTHRRRIGYVFQESSLFPHTSVRGNLEFGLRRTPQRDRRFALDEVAHLLGLDGLLHREPETLSGGQRQRVAIARALLRSPNLLMFDEPMASLDVDSRTQLLPYLSAVHRTLAIPVLYVTHSPAEVVRLADRVLYLKDGRVVANAALNDVLTDPALPLSRFDDAGAVVNATVTGHDPTFHLTELGLGNARFSVSERDVAVGEHVRLHVRARDVALSRRSSRQTSAQNVVSGSVLSVHEESDAAHRLVRLSVDGHVLLSRITLKAQRELDLRAGVEIFAHVKSVALAE